MTVGKRRSNFQMEDIDPFHSAINSTYNTFNAKLKKEVSVLQNCESGNNRTGQVTFMYEEQ